MMLAELAIRNRNASNVKRSRLVVGELRAVLESHAPTSKLGRWFSANQVEFAKLLKSNRPRWEALAVKFAEAGLISVPPAFWAKVDSPGRCLARKRAGEAARQIWQRVKRKPAGGGQVVPPSPSLPAAQHGPARVALRDPLLHDVEDDEFRLARPRKG